METGKPKSKKKWIYALVMFTLISGCVAMMGNNDQYKQAKQEREVQDTQKAVEAAAAAKERENKLAVQVCVTQYVKGQLKAPATAKFPHISMDGILKGAEADQGYFVNSYVDSQNAFGAMLRTTFVCNVKVLDAKGFNCQTSCDFAK